MDKKIIKIEAQQLKTLCKDKPDAVRTYFDKYKIIQNLYWKRLDKMLDISGRFHAKTVLDLGCGEGVLLPSLSKYYEIVYGIDIDISVAKKVKEIYKLENVTLNEEPILNNSYEDNKFDLIFAPSVMEHFKDLDQLLEELNRILNKNGRLVFSSPTETKLYELGRKIFGFIKPADHYHSVFEINDVARKYLKYEKKQNGPFSFIPSFLSVYVIYVFKKK